MKHRDLMEELNIMHENAMKEDRIELFHGRPARKSPITNEDVIMIIIKVSTLIFFI